MPTLDAHEFIASLDEVDLVRFRVVGTYTRYDEGVRNALLDARQKILAGFQPPGRKRENHLIWAAPGTGKTYFVQQVATSLAEGIHYQEINLAKCTEPEFRAALGALDGDTACLCLVDEVDAKPQEPWPYEVLLPYLDAAVEKGARFVFVLAGSSGASITEIKQRISARPKGADLLSRIPTGHECAIGPMSLGDRVLIALSQLRQAGQEMGREIRAVEKLGLYYVAMNQRLANARQLREFAVRAVERVPTSDDRVKYDHLFVPGDPENKAFWVQALPVAERLVNTFVTVAGDRVSALPPTTAPNPIGAGSAESRVRSAAVGPHRPTNLPRQLTSFVGRAREMAEVNQLLATTSLLTLTGTGGCGKTRLALRVAADLVDHYPNGVWLAQLAPLSDPTLVPKTVASALSLPEQPGRALTETLVDYLRPKSLLLILDNCEHLLHACAHLVETLLQACPNLRILTASRETLGIAGELTYRVPSLSLPDLKHLPPPETLTEYEAVRLFVERAAFSKPGFHITRSNAVAVAEVVHRLDGIPLAIELAAARVKALSVDVITTRLNDQFRLLTGGSRTGLPRHQTLRATLDWSHDLLSDQERILLRRLSVFAGGFTLEAAEKICASNGVDEADVIDVLTHLVDKSLVVFDERDQQPRYRLLETVRQYGRERLQEAGEAADVLARHRDWYLKVAEQAEPELRGPRQRDWLERLEAEHDNLRAGLEWSRTDQSGAEAGLRLAGALFWFWFLRGHWNEARTWLEGALARGSDVEASALPKATTAAALFAYYRNDLLQVSALAEKGLAMSRDLGNKEGIAWSLALLGLVALTEHDYERAKTLYEDSLAVSRELGNAWLTGMMVAQVGDLAFHQGDFERAAAHFEEALAISRQVGDAWLMAFSFREMGHVANGQEDYPRAAALFRESLALCREVDSGWVAEQCLEGLAKTASAQNHNEQAARLFGAVEALRETLGLRRQSQWQVIHDRRMASIRAGMGEEAAAAAWAEGLAMTLEQAIEYALNEAS